MMRLVTTDPQLHHLQHAVNEARAGSASVRVDKAALVALLKDHHTMYGALTARRQEPVPPD